MSTRYRLIALVIIGLLATMASRNLTRNRVRSGYSRAILEEIRLIDAAKDQWAIDTKAPETATPNWADLIPYFKKGTRLYTLTSPKDILNHDITLNPVNQLPTVSQATIDHYKEVIPIPEAFWGSYAPSAPQPETPR